MKRKDFLCGAALLGTTGTILSTLDSCSKEGAAGPTVDFTIDITQTPYNALQTIGGVVRKSGVIIVKDNSGNIVAVAEACTHEGCNVSYDSGTQTFPCPCHGAKFSLTGSVLNGPAQTNLKKYTTTLTGNMLRVNG